MSFCHCHLHSQYSFLDGLSPVNKLVEKANALGQPGICLTDHGVMFGAVQFFKAVRAANENPDTPALKGVIGMEAYEAVPHAFDLERDKKVFTDKYDPNNPRYHHLTLWAMNPEGYRNLCALHAKSWEKEHKPKNQPLVDRAMLEEHNGGVMVGLGCMASRTNYHLMNDPGTGAAYEAAKFYVECFEDRVYMEVMGNMAEQIQLQRPQRKLAERLGVPVLGDNDVHYLEREDGEEFGPHHILVQARKYRKKEGEDESGDKSDAGYGEWYGTDQFYLKSEEQMLATQGILPDEVARTQELIDRVTFDFWNPEHRPDPRMPGAPVPAEGVEPRFDAFVAAART